MRLIEADTLSNQNIATELLAGSYTADAELAVFARVFLAQIAGNGAYRASVFVQRRGIGSAYRHIPAGGDYVFVASGVTTVCATTDTVPLETTDVMTVYVTGLAADTTTPDIVVEFWEADTNDTISDAVWASASRTLTGGVALADDAITAAKFDESTAFPLKSADTGATAVARAGADADTLETLSDQLDAQEPVDVWTYVARTLTSQSIAVTAAVSGGAITIQRGDTLSASLAGMGNISTRTKLWFTVKSAHGDADSAAIIQIEETAGLVYLNGAAGTALQGDITVDDAVLGNITITLGATSTAALAAQSGLAYDVQMLTASGVTTLAIGACAVSADVTRAIA